MYLNNTILIMVDFYSNKYSDYIINIKIPYYKSSIDMWLLLFFFFQSYD